MFQDEAMVNQVLNYSKVLVDQIEKEKGIHTCPVKRRC